MKNTKLGKLSVVLSPILKKGMLFSKQVLRLLLLKALKV